eukprot:5562652-Pyramimonas_sp.AAC.1
MLPLRTRGILGSPAALSSPKDVLAQNAPAPVVLAAHVARPRLTAAARLEVMVLSRSCAQSKPVDSHAD